MESIRAAAGADLLVLPELASSGYMFRDRDEARAAALAPDGPEIAEWARAITGDMIVVCGFPEPGPSGAVYNSVVVLDRRGVLATYRKAHLWDNETTIFTPGSERPPVLDTPIGRLGVIICYDLEFPEYTRLVAMAGADALVVPTNWPLMERPPGEKAAEVLIAQAAARVNRMAVLLCDRSGDERGQAWTAGTCAISHDGWVLATAGRDGIVEVDIDLTAGRSKEISGRNDLFRDRRTDLY